MKKQLISGFTLSLFSTLAFSHPGHGLATTYAGFIHPFTGWDHLLVMIAIGIWAAKIGGHARWALPVTFLLSMTLGALMGFSGIGFAGVESVIATSVIAMGLLLLIQLPISLGMRIGLTALFALFHGMAHGVELMAEGRYTVLAGMLVATGLLHGIGLIFGTHQWRHTEKLNNMFAFALIIFGAFSLV